MESHNTIQHPGRKLFMHTVFSILVIVLGVVSLIYMIVVEDEPGAVPLLLIGSGIAWLTIARIRMRRRHG